MRSRSLLNVDEQQPDNTQHSLLLAILQAVLPWASSSSHFLNIMITTANNDSDRPSSPILLDVLSPHIHDYRPSDTDDEDDGHDIYRGDPIPQVPRPPSPALSTSSSSSSSSSSNSSVFGRRLGAISAGVEHAIARWARAWASSSSLDSSSSSESTASAFTTATKSQTRKRKARSIVRSEREITARIRAREELRHVPRSFVLYTPEPQDLKAPLLSLDDRRQKRVLRTDSLPEICDRLAASLKANNGKNRRPPRSEPVLIPPLLLPLPASHHDYMLPEDPKEALPPVPSSSIDPLLRKKGKNKEKSALPRMTIPSTQLDKALSPPVNTDRLTKAWWLDVSSPSWEDMRAIGKVCYVFPCFDRKAHRRSPIH